MQRASSIGDEELSQWLHNSAAGQFALQRALSSRSTASDDEQDDNGEEFRSPLPLLEQVLKLVSRYMVEEGNGASMDDDM